MNKYIGTVFPVAIAGSILTLSLVGCAAPRQVQTGDEVALHFTCRQDDGAVAVTTRAEVSDSDTPKSRLFVKRLRTDPLTVKVGNDSEGSHRRKSFEAAVAEGIAQKLVGLPEGATVELAVTAERLPVTPGNDHTVRLGRVVDQPKELRIPIALYKTRSQNDPKVGDPFRLDATLAGKVTAVNEAEVTITLDSAASEADRPFGRVTITDQGDHYRMETHPLPGTLVRTGAMAGKITTVDDQYFTVDYGHPFGGEVLRCAVEVGRVQSGKERKGQGKRDAVGVAAANGAAADGGAPEGRSATQK
ncbi:peptidylprolyl isomerase [Geomesophilobacter sediminis]|uniref:peptidylprolyl isomerase n=1 Tax=Geomesophilobacter sediminis TaxID=2798584 RepID=A0A8J7M0B3_9BACT|nr:hypothetical protein [Geomesophilobacter sediminis]MBJ6724287.1 hypothetical protein [Geomesophilobacter sediminis]